MLEHALEAGAFASVRGVRFVAAVALVVVKAAAYDLFGSEAEFGVRFAAVITSGEQASGEQAGGDERERQHRRGSQK